MDVEMDCAHRSRCEELKQSSSFYRRIYAEIEEIGWEQLVRMGQDLTFFSLRVMDKKKRAHIVEIRLDNTYPQYPPMLSADVPYIFNLKWSAKSKLNDLVQQFEAHLDKLQDFWSTLDDIDKSLWVVEPKHPDRAMSVRQINIGNDCYIVLSIDANDPKSLPECRFLGSDSKVNSFRKLWRMNCAKWNKEKSFCENLAIILNLQLPQPPDVEISNEQIECGICYAQYLPADDELGDKSGTATDYTCENNSCRRAFHNVCLADWLRSITTTRQSFDVLFGNCPYCSDPIAVKINHVKRGIGG